MSDVPPDRQHDGDPSGDQPPPPPYPGSGPPPYPGGSGAPPQYPTYPPSDYPQAPGSGYGGPGYPPPPAPPGSYSGIGRYEPAGNPDLSPYATYGSRVGGWLIDFVILGIVGYLLGLIFDAGHIARVNITTHTLTHGTTVTHVNHFSALGPVIQVVIVLLYGAIMCGSRRGQTVGMMAVGARAVDRDTGGPIGFGRALGRGAMEYLLFVLLFIPWIIDMLFPAWDRRSQTLHDKVSKTVVVKATMYPPT